VLLMLQVDCEGIFRLSCSVLFEYGILLVVTPACGSAFGHWNTVQFGAIDIGHIQTVPRAAISDRIPVSNVDSPLFGLLVQSISTVHRSG
jgi:hypothetical protein